MKSSKPSVYDAAWAAFRKSEKQELDPAEELKAQGWREGGEIAKELGITPEAFRKRQRRNPMLETRPVRVRTEVNSYIALFYRPKVTG